MCSAAAGRHATAHHVWRIFAASLTALTSLLLAGCPSGPPQPPAAPTRVMVIGGYNSGSSGGPDARREIYFFNSGSGNFEEPPHFMGEGRYCHTATFVNFGRTGFVLVTGGFNATSVVSKTAEIIFPDGSRQTTGSMQRPRTNHQATGLLDGRVLITGGQDLSGNTRIILGDTEIYDPSTGAFTQGNFLFDARFGHTATLIEDGPARGKVLVAGGAGAGDGAEIFDPATGMSTRTIDLGGTKMTFPRAFHTATWLPGLNQVLIAGGEDPRTTRQATAQAELFDPATNGFTRVGDMRVPRYFHTATNIGLNVVLITGGVDSSGNTHRLAELFDPLQKSFALTTHAMTEQRSHGSAALLAAGPLAGQVLVVGGNTLFDDAELFDPAQQSFAAVPPQHGQFGSFCQTATPLP